MSGVTATWEFADRQFTPVHGSKNHISVRYSAAAVAYKGDLIVTHGYFYNHAIRHPAWQSDAWAFNFASRTWRKLHDGEQAGAPSARYSCSAVLYEDALWLYGGDDGGHKRSMFNYVFKAWFDEMWRFDLRTYVWHKVTYKSQAPPKRALHSAVAIGKSMFVYGGLELADTWRYDFEPATWTLLVPTPSESDDSHPGRRHAFSAATASSDGFYIFGGTRHVKGQRPQAFGDLWYFKISSSKWSRLSPTAGMPSPSPRSHLSLVALTSTKLMLYGGALCVPGCSCHGDSWIWDIPASKWTELNASNAPIHRYRQSLVVHRLEGAAYLFGGESYRPYMYHNAVNRLQLPAAIASEMIAQSPASPESATTIAPSGAQSGSDTADPSVAAKRFSKEAVQLRKEHMAKKLEGVREARKKGVTALREFREEMTGAIAPLKSKLAAGGNAAQSTAHFVKVAGLPTFGLLVVAWAIMRYRKERACRYKYRAVGSAESRDDD